MEVGESEINVSALNKGSNGLLSHSSGQWVAFALRHVSTVQQVEKKSGFTYRLETPKYALAHVSLLKEKQNPIPLVVSLLWLYVWVI
jgi:hypothetical protein